MPRFLIAPDSFKGSFAAPDVAAAMSRGLRAGGGEVAAVCPLSDGGEGTMDVLRSAIGGSYVTAAVHDPLGWPIEANFVLLDDGRTAIVETAEASGLHQVDPDEYDPELASTGGTGELIAEAAQRNASRILVAAGGSATTDGGVGAIEAIERSGGLRGARLDVLCDVETPFEQAAVVFGPQKGANTETVRALTDRLQRQAAGFPRNPIGIPMTGCAGGLSGGLWAVLGAELHGGAEYVFRLLGLPEKIMQVDAVVSGEGRLDAQSFDGKVVGALAALARETAADLHVIAGSSAMPDDDELAGIASVRIAGSLDQIEASARQIATEQSPSPD